MDALKVMLSYGEQVAKFGSAALSAEELQSVIEALTSRGKCQSCGQPLSGDCDRCKHLWES